MKVLFWMSGNFDSHSTSEHLLKAIIYQLGIQGHSIHILQKDTKGKLPHIPEELTGLDVTTDTIFSERIPKNSFIKRYLKEIKYINKCKEFIHLNYDAVFIQSTPVSGITVWVARHILGDKTVVTLNVQDIFPYNAVYSGKIKRKSLAFKWLSRIQRYGYLHSDHIITISEDMKDTLVKDGVPEKSIEVIYNWSYQDEVYEDLDLTPVSHMFNSDFFNVVYAGNIGVMQNVDLLIETANLMKNDNTVWFHIIGDGVYKEKLITRAKKYGIQNISFWPMQSPELAPLIYSAADVNVIPLVKDIYKTALPSKTATCLACQKPIIFAIGKESKFGQKVSKETGCPVIDAENPEELKCSIQRIKSHETIFNTINFFKTYCGIAKNSKKYANTILRNS